MASGVHRSVTAVTQPSDTKENGALLLMSTRMSKKEEAKNLDIVASSLADSAGRFVFFLNERKSDERRTKYKLCFFFITKAKG